MEKQKRWQFYLILAVIVLTLFIILPTVFYYTKPLKEPVSKERAETVALNIIGRVDQLEKDSKAWLKSFCNLLSIQPTAIHLKEDDPSTFLVTFNNANDANTLKRFLPRAGALIPFVPSQLELMPGLEQDPKTVFVSRQINVNLDPAEANHYFHYYKKSIDDKPSLDYRKSVYDRVEQLAVGFGGESKAGLQMLSVINNPGEAKYNDLAINLAKEITDVYQTFGENNPITKRYLGSLAQVNVSDKKAMLQKFSSRINLLKADVEKQMKPLVEEKESLQKKGASLDSSSEQRLSFLENRHQGLKNAAEILKGHEAIILSGKAPLTASEAEASLVKNEAFDPKDPIQILSLEGRDPFVESLVINWGNDKIVAHLYPEIQQLRKGQGSSEEAAYLKEKVNHYLIEDIARTSRLTDESLKPDGANFAAEITSLSDPTGFLALDLGFLAEKRSQQTASLILSEWAPQYVDFSPDSFPVIKYDDFKKLTPQEQKLGLIVYAPAMFSEPPIQGFHNTSIYVIARGLDAIIQKYKEIPNAPGAATMQEDVENLSRLLQDKGFIGYKGSSYGLPKEFSQDYIFELDDYYTKLLNATREDFYVKGSKKNAILDFTDVEQRIITLNHIDDRIQEDLLKWKDEYDAAQVSLDLTKKYEVPPPTKNVYWQNLKLSFIKYFRGDDRKILRWGLDLSGGKTVRIGLRDQNNKVVSDPEDLNQAVNELYTRINKMGVAERTIRIENNNIILDFPGSQALSASDLVKAASMSFHIVNEKFSQNNADLREMVSQFLQNVWNEAVVTNRKDVQSINEIAWAHMGGSQQGSDVSEPKSEAAKILYEHGLRLASPNQPKSSAFDDTLSSIAVLQGNDFTEWYGQANPLLIVFHNYALEGSELTNIQVGYDPSEGNVLSFSVKSSYGSSHKGSGNPRDDFYAWTSQYAEDKIAGTPKETYSQGQGWRMAVILNNSVITMPHLRAALRDAATISGRFTQREITQLAADLKAGSLSFTPRILSEQNVSAELGKEERVKGIVASLVSLFLVAAMMIGYYRFAGVVATCAVLFNLLIMWAVLVNLGAALSLPGIAGIVLTIGMAVDANVLVFERIREEFKISGRIASAIQAGYRKAFSAIVDSNITTIIAALILTQFDSGPIKGFAVALIIGLISSMFTALFMTRYFFAGWVQNPKHKVLRMAEWIKDTKIDFLSYAKPAIVISLIIIIAGGYFFVSQRNIIFGMDFTGGYSLMLELEEKPGEEINFRSSTSQALMKHGASSSDFQIRELNKPNHLRIQFGLGMEQKGHPFFGMPESLPGNFEYEYQKDPRIVWVVNSLKDAGLVIQTNELPNLDKNWTMMSGQFSNAMRDNAIIALGIALVSILIYITFRFEFKFAAAAVIALVHDVLITLGILAVFRKIGMPVQINLEVVGAIMTLIGYSLNDTIIVFDRVREDLKLLRKMKYSEIINHALNVTLSRTLMTSGTTLLVLISLVVLGGHSIFDFSLVMTIGVLVGTFSSLFIASPVMLYFHNKEEKRNEIALKRI